MLPYVDAWHLTPIFSLPGGGLNGPALALGLAQAGFSVTLVDPRPEQARAGENFDGRAYALALGVETAFGRRGRLGPR